MGQFAKSNNSMTKMNNVIRMLRAKKVDFKIHELPSEKLSAIEAGDYLGVEPGRIFKTIVALRADGGKAVLALVPAEAKVEMKALGRALGGEKLRAASQAQAEEITGLQTGGISPLALIGKAFDTILDASALNFEEIYISSGQRGLNVSLQPSDLIALSKAKTAAISSV